MRLKEQLAKAKERADEQYALGIKAANSPFHRIAPDMAQAIGMQTRDEDRRREQFKHGKRGWSFAAIRPIATRFADQPILMARKTVSQSERVFQPWQRAMHMPNWTKGIAMDLEPVSVHRLLDAIEDPNDKMVQSSLMWVTAATLQITGEAYWWFKEDGENLRIWPVPPHWISDPYEKNGTALVDIKAPGTVDDPIPVPVDHIAQFKLPDPEFPSTGMSPLSAAARPILSDDAILESQFRGFSNGGNPDLAFVLGEEVRSDGKKVRPELTEQQEQELARRLNQLYAGPANSKRYVLLDALISDAKKLSNTPQEMDFLQSGKATKQYIMQVFGVNAVIAGENENANRASATVATEIFLENVINPMLTLVGQVLTRFVNTSPLFVSEKITQKHIVYFEEAKAKDPVEERRRWDRAAEMGWVGEDDYRTRILGLPPLGRGNLAKIDANARYQRLDEPLPQNEPQQQESFSRLAFSKAHSNFRAQGEEQLREGLQKLFIAQAGEIAKRLRDSGGIVPAHSLLDLADEQQRLVEAARPHLENLSVRGAGLQRASFRKHRRKDILDDLFGNSQPVNWAIQDYMNELMRQTFWAEPMATMREDLQRILDRGVREGMDIGSLSREIHDELGRMSFSRANRIARTESTGALNAGAFAVQQQLSESGAVIQKEWLTLIDDRTRGIDPSDQFDHVKMDGARVAVKSDFNVDGEPAPFPGHFSLSAGNRINCRCGTASVDLLDDDLGIPPADRITFTDLVGA